MFRLKMIFYETTGDSTRNRGNLSIALGASLVVDLQRWRLDAVTDQIGGESWRSERCFCGQRTVSCKQEQPVGAGWQARCWAVLGGAGGAPSASAVLLLLLLLVVVVWLVYEAFVLCKYTAATLTYTATRHRIACQTAS